jgi:hypothetical protein
MAILSAGIGSLLERIKERTLNEPAEASGAPFRDRVKPPQWVGGITPESMGGITPEWVGEIIPESLGGLSPEWWAQSLRNHHNEQPQDCIKTHAGRKILTYPRC